MKVETVEDETVEDETALETVKNLQHVKTKHELVGKEESLSNKAPTPLLRILAWRIMCSEPVALGSGGGY